MLKFAANLIFHLQFIVSLLGSDEDTDKEELEMLINRTRILENAELPSSVASLFTKSINVSEDDDVENAAKVDEPAIDLEKESVKGAVKEDVVKEKEPPAKGPQMVRMANLCVITGHTVNGVAAIHSDIVKDEVFLDFYKVNANLQCVE